MTKLDLFYSALTSVDRTFDLFGGESAEHRRVCRQVAVMLCQIDHRGRDPGIDAALQAAACRNLNWYV